MYWVLCYLNRRKVKRTWCNPQALKALLRAWSCKCLDKWDTLCRWLLFFFFNFTCETLEKLALPPKIKPEFLVGFILNVCSLSAISLLHVLFPASVAQKVALWSDMKKVQWPSKLQGSKNGLMNSAIKS